MDQKIKFKWTGIFLLVLGGIFSPLSVWAQGSESKQPAAVGKKEKTPDLQFEQKVYDFGTVYKGAVVEHEFKFSNKGNAVLNIGKVKTSCGCTAALTSSKVIKPGDSGTIKAAFRSKNFRGKINKKIYVNSNDPDENKIQLVIKGTILEEITLNPQRISFNMVKQGTEQKKTFHIKQTGKNPLEIKDIKSNLKFLSAKVGSTDKIFDKKIGEKLDYEVEVTLAKDAPTGRFNGILTIKTNLLNKPDIRYTVSGVVQ